MAYVGYFTVYFGEDKSAAEQFEKSFDVSKFALPSNKTLSMYSFFSWPNFSFSKYSQNYITHNSYYFDFDNYHSVYCANNWLGAFSSYNKNNYSKYNTY